MEKARDGSGLGKGWVRQAGKLCRCLGMIPVQSGSAGGPAGAQEGTRGCSAGTLLRLGCLALSCLSFRDVFESSLRGLGIVELRVPLPCPPERWGNAETPNLSHTRGSLCVEGHSRSACRVQDIPSCLAEGSCCPENTGALGPFPTPV